MDKLKIEVPDITKDNLVHFRDYIKQRGGIYVEDEKLNFLRTILLNRITARGFNGYLKYHQFLKFHPNGEVEFKELLESLTINETCFFRNISHFSVLEKYIFPELIRERVASNSKFIKIWSAGCSTGEEPYSIAMLLSELIPDIKNWSIEILATDINNRVLASAKQGIYRKRSLRLVDDYYFKKYFTQEKASYNLSERVKEMVKFDYFNLLSERYPLSVVGKWDIIFCCNVMIYFQLETIQQVVKNFYDSLQEGGYFFTGYAETSQIISYKFQLVRMDEAFFYKKVILEPVQKAIILQKVPVLASREIPTTQIKAEKKEIPPVQVELTEKEIPIVQPDDLYNEAMELFIKEDYSDALEKLDIFLQYNPNDTRALLLLVQIYLEKGMLSEVLSVSDKIIELDSINDKAYYLRGFAHKQRKDFQKAIESFNKTIYLNRNNALAYYNLALIYKQMGEDKLTLKEFKNTLRVLNNYSPEEPLELNGRILPKILIDTCQKNIKKLSEADNM